MISPRTHEGRWHRVTVAIGAIALLAAMTLLTAQASPSTVRDRIRDTGTIRLGYRVDARPFSYSEAGRSSPTGYSVSVCQAVDLRGEASCHPKSVEVRDAVRKVVPAVDEDRRMDVDIAEVLKLYRRGALPLGPIDDGLGDPS